MGMGAGQNANHVSRIIAFLNDGSRSIDKMGLSEFTDRYSRPKQELHHADSPD